MRPTTEAATRALLIDPALRSAGWNTNDRSRVALEIPVDGYDKEPWNGVTDYCLYDATGNVIAVVEAKKCSRNARDADEQLRHYVTEIAKRQAFSPFGFMANGRDTYFWEVGIANPRPIAGFFSPDDLDRLLFIRQNQLPLASAQINTAIADRPYQHEAIRRVAEAYAKGKRRALVVMATGTGKTRTTMALIDMFFRMRQAQHVLFVADRDALVDQALTHGFKAHLPNEPRDRIYTHRIDTSKRLFVVTLQTLSVCFTKLSPGFFDLVVFDEVHRSIFNRFSEVVEYFDARLVGLTATPADFIDRDTFRVFECFDKVPTYLYTYPVAVKERYLVNFNLYQAQTAFQREGIKGVDLSEEERNALIEQGIDPDDIDYSGTDLEVTVSNRDSLRRQLEEVMEQCLKDQSGQLPGKTIVFAMTKAHAERIREVFEEMYPQYVGLAQVITSTTERVRDGSYGDGLISKFKKNDLPRIAISVDMLDTGIDIPEVVNLVFMKPVQSRIKLWQMIGRGTRSQAACRFFDRLPNGKKTEFKIIDFWQNDFERKTDIPTPVEMPVLVTIFNTRLKILETCLAQPDSDAFVQAVLDLREQILRIPTDSFPVRRVFPEIADAWEDTFWTPVTWQKIEFLRARVGPLLRFAAQIDVAAETFTSKVERLKLQILNSSPSPATLESIVDDVSRLPEFVLEDAPVEPSVKLCLSHELAKASPKALTQVIRDLAPQMKNRRDRVSAFLKLDLPDFIQTRGLISIGEGGEQVYVEQYRRRVEERILKIVENHSTMAVIRSGGDPTDLQLIELERTLQRELGGDGIELTTDKIRRAYGLKVDSFLGFLRHVLDLDALPDYSVVVERSFARHIAAHQYSADQIRFLRAVEEVFLRRRQLELQDFYQSPLTNFGRNAVDRLFTPAQVQEIIGLANQMAA
jgi:type I restriction enzyme R subunit